MNIKKPVEHHSTWVMKTHTNQKTRTAKSSTNAFKTQTDIHFPTQEMQDLLLVFATVRFTKRATSFYMNSSKLINLHLPDQWGFLKIEDH